MSKQTAVQWLHYHLLHLMQTREWRSKDLHIEKFDELFIEALAMEKEQMIETWENGYSSNEGVSTYAYSDKYQKTSEKYYNETYKGGEQ